MAKKKKASRSGGSQRGKRSAIKSATTPTASARSAPARERIVLRGPVALVPLGATTAPALVAAEARGEEGRLPIVAVAARPAGVPGTAATEVVVSAETLRARALSLDDLADRAPRQRVVLVEGDSWFNFPVPFAVALDWALRDRHRYNVDLHFARAGGTLKGMIYGNRRRDLRDVLNSLRRVKPRVMLFSGGGNDVVGPEFANYLNHKATGKPALREDFVALQYDTVFLPAYRHLVNQVRQASPGTRIFVHGYAHAFPSGRAVDLLFLDDLGLVRIGPWMKPSLEDNGWDMATGRQVVVRLIDRFNDMLAQLQGEFPGMFFHVDLRPVVTARSDWSDELHLTNRAWARCADRIHGAIAAAVQGW